VELQQVRYFLSLARTLNFTRAADECNVTQPALTKSIKRLEEALDGQLIYRQRNHTQLTPFGRAMLPLLEQIYSAAEVTKAQASMFHRLGGSTLRLGTSIELDTAFLVPVLRELNRHVTTLDLAWKSDGRDALVTMLVEGSLDVAILVDREKLPDQLHRWPLFSERYVAMCPPDHALAKWPEIPPELLRREKLLLPDRLDCDYRSALAALGAGEAGACRICQLASCEDKIEQLVLSGYGVSVSTESRRMPIGLVARPIAPPFPRRTILLVIPAGRRRNLAVDGFMKLARALRLGPSAGEGARDARP
jgi:DNA-binding transcriptional LysR family regulator